MKKIYYFVINGKVLAKNEDDAIFILYNLMNSKTIEEYQIKDLMTVA